MSGEVILRLGGYPEIDIWDFRDWFLETYFKISSDSEMYLGKFDVDMIFAINEEDKLITIQMDLVDYSELNHMSESLKRELREINRGGLQ